LSTPPVRKPGIV